MLRLKDKNVFGEDFFISPYQKIFLDVRFKGNNLWGEFFYLPIKSLLI